MLAASPIATPASAAPTREPVLLLPQEKALRSSSGRLDLLELFDGFEFPFERFESPRAPVLVLGDLLCVRVAMSFPPLWFWRI
jgi:hypothetical protein